MDNNIFGIGMNELIVIFVLGGNRAGTRTDRQGCTRGR